MMKPLDTFVVLGRAMGACVLAGFGTLWAVAAVFSAPASWRLGLGLSVAFTAACVGLAALHAFLRVRAAGKTQPDAPVSAAGQTARRRVGRRMGLINAAQGLAIALVSVAVARAGRPDLIMSAVALIVGLHFFALVPVLHMPSYALCGALIVAAAIAGAVAPAGPGRSVGLALAVALILWTTALDITRRLPTAAASIA
jgi:hypothetical protein